MRYGRHTAGVVVGGLIAQSSYVLSPEWMRLELGELFIATLTYGLVIIGGVTLGIYALFAGIESAVATGINRSDNESTE